MVTRGTQVCCGAVGWNSGCIVDKRADHMNMDLLILVYGYSINYLGPCRISLLCRLAADSPIIILLLSSRDTFF